MSVAYHFSGLLMGAIPAVITEFGATSEIVTLFSAVLGQEGQQDGYFRWLRQLVPNENPFLTTSVPAFFYNHILQQYVVPDTCPALLDFLPTYGKLLALSSPPARNSTLGFHTTLANVTADNYIAYMSGQKIAVEAITNLTHMHDSTTFEVKFPYDSGFSRGLTIAALVAKKRSFANTSDVAEHTLAGPALIEVNYN
jgi:hypothetical protein